MSRFIDKLNRVSLNVPQPIGFKATPATPSKPKMLLVASVAHFDRVADYVAGADASLLPFKLGAEAKPVKEISPAVTDIPWGGWLKDIGGEEIAQVVNTGCDFVVFPAASTALAIPPSNGVGKILEVAMSVSDSLLRAVDKLPVDAVLIGSEQDERRFLTWQHLMHFQRCADLLTKPLLALVPSNVVSSELQALWAAGVDGVVVEIEVEQPAGKVMELRKIIDELPPRRKREKPVALVPHVTGRVNTAAEETEEPEEE